jgi:hypothetical protein
MGGTPLMPVTFASDCIPERALVLVSAANNEIELRNACNLIYQGLK